MAALSLKPGELVVRRVRWHVDANLMGLVIGEENGSWLVLWTTGDRSSEFKWHLPDALQVVDLSNVPNISGRQALHP